MNITKIELLWSRACPYDCAGCAMPLDRPEHQGTVEQWRRGVENMARMGSKFVAIYGAEPLTRPKGLPELIRAIHSAGMKMTVITAIPHSPVLKMLLESTPLDSLTVSWDGIYTDKYRQAKAESGQKALLDHPNLRDRACVATVTKANADSINQMAYEATEQGYWFLFDLYHPGTGPLSKCRTEPGEIMLMPERRQIYNMAEALLAFKRNGRKIHASRHYLESLLNGYNGNSREFWHCHKRKTGWLTVNSDGSVLPCDDWQKVYSVGKIWDELDHSQLAQWKDIAVADCPGCAWNTHFDAVEIEEGIIPLGSYVH